MAKKTISDKPMNERGELLRLAHNRTHYSNINTGNSIIIDGVKIDIGMKCPVCKFRIRGMNHCSGDHHNGRVKQHKRR